MDGDGMIITVTPHSFSPTSLSASIVSKSLPQIYIYIDILLIYYFDCCGVNVEFHP